MLRSMLLMLMLSCSCSNDTINYENTDQDNTDDVGDTDGIGMTDLLYFPPTDSDSWETASPESLGWNQTALSNLDGYLQETDTKAFIILKDGRIIIENYYQDTNRLTNHRWNSAAKTLTASAVGIAQEEGLLNINNATSDYLGSGWTAMTSGQEVAITIKNQLTMTTGGDYTIDNINCTDPDCLVYLNSAGTEWYYHNAFYTLLQEVVSTAVSVNFDDYFETELASQIGMNGFWLPLGYFRLYYSDARSMARFGLLNLNRGNWDGTQIIDEAFHTEMTTSSQDLNKSYGYLWWLNGQEGHRLPGLTTTFSGKLIPTAPDDLIAGLGKDDQKVYAVPSEGLVVIRLGDDAGDATYGPSGFDTRLWEMIMEVVN